VAAKRPGEGGSRNAQAIGESPSPGARIIRAAQSEQDALVIFRFLCLVAPPVLHCPIAGEKAFGEIARVVAERDYGFAYMAFEEGALVGTLGAIFVSWWYGEDSFFTDRWFFTLPGRRWAGPRLLAEADAIARTVGVPLIVNLKQRRTIAATTFVKPVLLGETRIANGE
jgi:GNAT superfamily N-acetyltransferase